MHAALTVKQTCSVTEIPTGWIRQGRLNTVGFQKNFTHKRSSVCLSSNFNIVSGSNIFKFFLWYIFFIFFSSHFFFTGNFGVVAKHLFFSLRQFSLARHQPYERPAVFDGKYSTNRQSYDARPRGINSGASGFNLLTWNRFKIALYKKMTRLLYIPDSM